VQSCWRPPDKHWPRWWSVAPVVARHACWRSAVDPPGQTAAQLVSQDGDFVSSASDGSRGGGAVRVGIEGANITLVNAGTLIVATGGRRLPFRLPVIKGLKSRNSLDG